MVDLANQSFVCLTTSGGRVVFAIADKRDDVTHHAVTMARSLEQIEPDPGPNAGLESHGIARWSLGMPAIDEIQKILQGLTS